MELPAPKADSYGIPLDNFQRHSEHKNNNSKTNKYTIIYNYYSYNYSLKRGKNLSQEPRKQLSRAQICRSAEHLALLPKYITNCVHN